MLQILFKPLSKDEALRHEHIRSRPQSSIEQKRNNMLLNDYKSEVHLKCSLLPRPHHLHKRKTSCQSKELLKCITALWFYFESHFFMQLDTGCSSPVTSAKADFQGFVFTSSWIWPPAAAQCLSHEASNLLKVRVMRWTQQTFLIHTMDELLTNGSLDFAHDLIIRNCLPTFIVGDDLRLLTDFLFNKKHRTWHFWDVNSKKVEFWDANLQLWEKNSAVVCVILFLIPAWISRPVQWSLNTWAVKQTAQIDYAVLRLTVARSFWVRPWSCRPFWITLPTSSGTRWWWSSSVSWSSLAVFFVTRCCLFCPADPEIGTRQQH